MSRSIYNSLYRRYGKTLPESEVAARAAALIAADMRDFALTLGKDCHAKLKALRVAVVGGGFAGMMAAWTLCRADRNIEVVVFDARPDIGGRVWSSEEFAKGRVTEFGAELVGANHPLWLRTAAELGVSLITRTGSDDYEVMGLAEKFRIDGKHLTEKQLQAATDGMTVVFKRFGADARNCVEDPEKPWELVDKSKLMQRSVFDNTTVADKLKEYAPNPLAYRMVEIQIENDLLNPLDKINYLSLLCQVKAHRLGTKPDDDPNLLGYWEHLEDYRCSNGCQAVVTKMAAKLRDPREKYKFTLFTNAKVTGIAVDSANASAPVSVEWVLKATGKKTWKKVFDFAIVAVPPTVWNDIAITPHHPKELGPQQTGPGSKFFSNLEDRFWIAEGAAPSGVASDLGLIWEGTDNQMQTAKSEIVLAVYMGGPVFCGPDRNEAYLKRKLRELYPGYTASLRGKNPRLVSWEHEEFIKTGFACPQKGHAFQVARKLHDPLNDRIFLAGEHTQLDFFGFMEGALRSGRRAATSVITTVCPQPPTVTA